MYKHKCIYIFYICTHLDAHALANWHMWVRAGPHVAMADQISSTFEKCASVHVCVCVCVLYMYVHVASVPPAHTSKACV